MTDTCVSCGAVMPEGYGYVCLHCSKNLKERMDELTANEYQQLALRTVNPDLTCIEELENGLMGLNGEAGEAIDLLKKHLFQGHPLDKNRMVKELGDVAWYLAISAHAIDYPLEVIFRRNIEKLEHRYPEGFEPIRSIERNAEDV